MGGDGASTSTSSSPTHTQKLYSFLWEKFKKSYDLSTRDEESSDNTHTLRNILRTSPYIHECGKEDRDGVGGIGIQDVKDKDKGKLGLSLGPEEGSSFTDFALPTLYKKFYDGVQPILPLCSSVLLTYPSDLHYYGRVALITVVTGLVIEKTLETLPDVEQLREQCAPFLHCNLLDGSDPNQPGRVGLDKDFF